jgi:hypothetical protein
MNLSLYNSLTSNRPRKQTDQYQEIHDLGSNIKHTYKKVQEFWGKLRIDIHRVTESSWRWIAGKGENQIRDMDLGKAMLFCSSWKLSEVETGAIPICATQCFTLGFDRLW